MEELDTQQIELIGTAALEAELIRQGFEIARPNRDRGIDLIVYSDEKDKPFSAVPIQVKVASKESFSIYRKYEKFEGIIFAYIWNATTDPRFFLLTYDEAVALVPNKEGKSWEKGSWHWSKPPKSLKEELNQYEDRWGLIYESLT